MNWTNKKVLVTGAGGFIGSHLVELLHDLGARVRAVVHYNSRNDWGMLEFLPRIVLDELDVCPSDITDPFEMGRIIKDCDIVFHLAALTGIPYSYTAPAQYVAVNITGTVNIFQACLQNGTERVIHTSTSEVYGTAQYVPIDESHPLQGQSPYSASKIAADMLAESFFYSFDFPVAIVRPFNTYGPRQSARGVIPSIVTQALTRDQIYLGNLSPIRDWTYVKDMVRAFIALAECEEAIGRAVNIGSGIGISTGELVDKLLNLMENESEVLEDEARIRPAQSEVERLICDTTRAQDLLGWAPAYSLEEGLEETVHWIEKNPDWYKPDIYNI